MGRSESKTANEHSVDIDEASTRSVSSKKSIEMSKSYDFALNCWECEEHFGDMNSFFEHLKRAHYDGDENEKPWLVSHNFLNHLSVHKNTKCLTCKLCGDLFQSKGGLYRHLSANHHLKGISSDSDSLGSETDEDLTVPSSIASKVISWPEAFQFFVKCWECGEEFDEKDEFMEHLKSVHYDQNEKRTWLKCEKCEYRATCRISFIGHLSMHKKVKCFSCKICGKNIRQSNNLREHMKNLHHLTIETKRKAKGGTYMGSLPLSSDSSSSSLSSSSEDEENGRINSPTIDWKEACRFKVKCHICKVRFDDKLTYANHLKNTHYLKGKWKTCEFCKKKSKTGYAFISHLSTHTKKTPFRCRLKDVKEPNKACPYGVGGISSFINM